MSEPAKRPEAVVHRHEDHVGFAGEICPIGSRIQSRRANRIPSPVYPHVYREISFFGLRTPYVQVKAILTASD